jgi:isopentenyl-diphosphate delta-isomerase
MNTHDIILVDQHDQQVGTGEKLEVHQNGWLHRAFSVVVFNNEGKMLLQKRAYKKYHCGGLWTNSCCSHPFPGEDTFVAAHRRLKEEMGFDCELTYHHHFIYKVKLENGLVEHELDHVFIGEYNGLIVPDKDEVADFRFVSLDVLNEEVHKYPQRFTPWFLIILKRINTLLSS